MRGKRKNANRGPRVLGKMAGGLGLLGLGKLKRQMGKLKRQAQSTVQAREEDKNDEDTHGRHKLVMHQSVRRMRTVKIQSHERGSGGEL